MQTTNDVCVITGYVFADIMQAKGCVKISNCPVLLIVSIQATIISYT